MRFEFQDLRLRSCLIKPLTLREKALIFGWKNNNDVVNAWWSLNKGIESTYYDRVPPLIIQGLIDYVEDLVGRRNQVDKEDLK